MRVAAGQVNTKQILIHILINKEYDDDDALCKMREHRRWKTKVLFDNLMQNTKQNILKI